MDIKDRLKNFLKETNPWWKDNSFLFNKYIERDIYIKIEKFLPMRQIIALTGLRRTGKTTLMLRVAEQFLHKMPAKNILYFSFDDFFNIDIEDILDVYAELFDNINFKKDKFLFCFDEIQKLLNWQEKVKKIYDLYPKIKIIVSGSESLFIRKKMKETLGGRIFEFMILPLSFKEYLYFIKKEKFIENIELYKKEIVFAYKKYLKINGFPELVNCKDDMVIYKYIKETIIDKILFKDIPQLFKVKNTEYVAELFDIIMCSPGQIIDASSLSKELKLSRQSVSSYLDYLEKSFLIRKLYNFSGNIRKQKRALKKYYPAIITPEILETKFALCFENSLIWSLDVQFFYRDAYQNEVDIIIIDKGKKFIPIEVKTGKIELKGINFFMKKYKISKGFVISIEKEEKIGNIEIIPFYKYLF